MEKDCSAKGGNQQTGVLFSEKRGKDESSVTKIVLVLTGVVKISFRQKAWPPVRAAADRGTRKVQVGRLFACGSKLICTEQTSA